MEDNNWNIRKHAGLMRVRAAVSAMQHPEDLQRVLQVLNQEFIALGLPHHELSIQWLYDDHYIRIHVTKESVVQMLAYRSLQEIFHRFKGSPVEHAILSQRIIYRALAYAVAHDLRAPLRAIHGFAEVLLEDFANALPERAFDHLKRIANAAQRMHEMVESLLNYTRLTRRRLQRERIALHPLIRACIDEESELIHQKGAKVNLQISSQFIFGNATLLKLLIRNLLRNAVLYSRPNVPPVVEIQCCESDNGVLLSVCDNGLGIPRKYHEEIFNLFQRLHSDSEVPGIGMGLAMVKRIAELHGGYVRVESEPGKGTTFYVWLPQDAERDTHIDNFSEEDLPELHHQ